MRILFVPADSEKDGWSANLCPWPLCSVSLRDSKVLDRLWPDGTSGCDSVLDSFCGRPQEKGTAGHGHMDYPMAPWLVLVDVPIPT